jgi:hypothetical protein
VPRAASAVRWLATDPGTRCGEGGGWSTSEARVNNRQGEEGRGSPTVHANGGVEKNGGSSTFRGGSGIRWPEEVAARSNSWKREKGR